MLKKKSEISLMPVILSTNKKQIGIIKDVVLSKQKTKIVAFVMSNGSLLKQTKIIPYRNILNVGSDFIEVKDFSSIEKLSLYPELEHLYDDKTNFIGSQIISTKGKDVGYVKDYIIDLKTGKIYCFVVSDGIFEDLIEGRQLLPYCEGMVVNENNIIIEDNLLATLQNTKTGGLNNLLH
jgi:uncharacterized protein YrrD